MREERAVSNIHSLAWGGKGKGHVHRDPGVEQKWKCKQRFKRGWEKRKNSGSARALSSHGCRRTRLCIWGSGNMQLPCPMVSVLLTLGTPSSTPHKVEKGTFAKLVFGCLVISEFSHRCLLKFYPLPEVCQVSHKTSKSKLPLQIQLSEVEHTVTSQWGPFLN